jgi:vacuolar protein sorting-associated protein 1
LTCGFRSIGWELKNNIPFTAKKTLIQSFTSLWEAPAMACFNAVYSGLASFTKKLIDQYFSPFDKLKEWMRSVIVLG